MGGAERRSRPRHTECVKSGSSGGSSRSNPKVELEAVGGEKRDGGETKIDSYKKCKADLYISWISRERGIIIVV